MTIKLLGTGLHYYFLSPGSFQAEQRARDWSNFQTLAPTGPQFSVEIGYISSPFWALTFPPLETISQVTLVPLPALKCCLCSCSRSGHCPVSGFSFLFDVRQRERVCVCACLYVFRRQVRICCGAFKPKQSLLVHLPPSGILEPNATAQTQQTGSNSWPQEGSCWPELECFFSES